MNIEGLRKLWSGDQQRMEEEYSTQSETSLEAVRGNARISRNLATGLTVIGATIGIGAALLNSEAGQFTTSFADAGLILALSIANRRTDNVLENRIIAINRVIERRRQQVMRSVGLTPLQGI